MNRRLASILVILGIGFFILGLWLYYRMHFIPCATPDCAGPLEMMEEYDVVEEIAPGVMVVDKSMGRYLINERDGYEVEIGEGLEIKEVRNNIAFYNYDEFHLPVFTFSIEENKDNLDIDRWLEKYHKENFLLFYDERERMDINDLDIIMVREEGEVDVYAYYILLGERILIFTTPQEMGYEDIIDSINSLKEGNYAME